MEETSRLDWGWGKSSFLYVGGVGAGLSFPTLLSESLEAWGSRQRLRQGCIFGIPGMSASFPGQALPRSQELCRAFGSGFVPPQGSGGGGVGGVGVAFQNVAR